LASPELFSVASGLKNSPRGTNETAEMYAGRNFLSPRKLPTLLIPNLYGETENNVLSKLLLKPPVEMKVGFWELLIFGQPGSVYNRILAYIGLLPFLFYLVSIHLWKDSRIKYFWLLAALPLLFLILINFTIFNQLITWIWSGARTLDHSRLLVLCVFAFSTLAAFGLDAIQSAAQRKAAASMIKTAAILFAFVFVVLMSGNFAGNFLQKQGLEYYSKQASYYWKVNEQSFYSEAFAAVPVMFSETAKIFVFPALLCSIGAISLFFFTRGKISVLLCMSIITGLTVVDLLYFGRTDPPIYFSPPQAFAPGGIEPLEMITEGTRDSRVMEIQSLKPIPDVPLKHYSSLDEYYTRGVRFFDFNSFDFVARPDSLLHYGIPTSSGYLGFYPARYFRLHRGRPNDILHYIKPNESVDIWSGGWIDMQSIRYILAVPGATSEKYQVAYSSKDLTVFENENAVPLMYFSPRIKIISDASKALEHIRSEQFNPHEYTILEEDSGLSEIQIGSRSITTEKKSSTITATVQTSTDSLLVLSQNYYPGWRAFVDGKQVPILKANYTFQAIRVPTGKHSIKFSFEVVYFRMAVAFTAIGLLIWFLFFVKLA
jgi:Bacterial membrane protein YfhO